MKTYFVVTTANDFQNHKLAGLAYQIFQMFDEQTEIFQ